MDNKRIAAIFDEIGDILDIKGENRFRVNAYKRAALNILSLGRDLRDIVDKNPDDVDKIPGIGKDLEAKIVELVQTGRCQWYEKLKKSFPAGLLDILRLRGVGPKKVKLFYSELGIKDLKQLKKAAETGVLRELEGMGEKSEKDVLSAIEEASHFSPDRTLISEALAEAERLMAYMERCSAINKMQYAGSLRRSKETIGDIDILVTAKDSARVMDHFVKYRGVLDVIAKGDTKSSVTLESGMDVDLRVVKDESFGAAMHYFTGSKGHNIRVRDIAKKKGIKVNEYGVWRDKKLIVSKKEEDVFKAVGLPYIIPEIRRDSGEIEYAQKNKKMPDFIEQKDIKGDLHMHSNYSDGDNTIAEMAEACRKMGYQYMSISDHSSVVGVTGGMGKKDIKKQWKEVDKLNRKFGKKFKIFKSSEVDILKDGTLDFDDDVLKELDIVIIAAHLYNRSMPSTDQTKRLIAAIENPYSRILAHPTGRLINHRAEMPFDMGKIIDACVANKVALEINSNPSRLDLSERHIKMAKEKGAKFTVDTDAHNPKQLDYMKFGIGMARRGWLEKADVINTMSLTNLTRHIK